jgi:hypothetical protein
MAPENNNNMTFLGADVPETFLQLPETIETTQAGTDSAAAVYTTPGNTGTSSQPLPVVPTVESSMQSKNIMPFVLAAGAGAVLFLITKKKRKKVSGGGNTLLLIGAGAGAAYFLYKYLKNQQTAPVAIPTEAINTNYQGPSASMDTAIF